MIVLYPTLVCTRNVALPSYNRYDDSQQGHHKPDNAHLFGETFKSQTDDSYFWRGRRGINPKFDG